MSFTIHFHIFIVIGLTFILGTIVRKYFLKKPFGDNWVDKLYPFVIVYVPLAITYAFIVDELPLTGFSIDPIYDTNDSPSLGPQSVSGNSIVALVITIGTILVNILVWLLSVFLIVRHFVKRRPNN